MAGIFGVVSLITSVLNTGAIVGHVNTIGFSDDNLPLTRPGKIDSSVRIAVALNGDERQRGALRHAAGEAPWVLAFNENQNYCGASDPVDHRYIPSGSFVDLIVWQNGVGPGEQATSLQIIPTDNELCVAYVAQTWADGTHRGWSGDMGKACARQWYYSNIVVGDDHKPTCTWIDKDHSHGIKAAALQIHMQDFSNLTTVHTKDPAFYCTHPTMFFKRSTNDYHWRRGWFEGPKKPKFWDASDPAVVYANDEIENDGVGRRKDKRTRSSEPHSLARRSGLAAFPHLIASPHDRHSAVGLCDDERSHGPDFLSLAEGVFCDMETKTVWPLCGGGDSGSETTEDEGCYHFETHSLVLGEERVARNYSHVVEWD